MILACRDRDGSGGHVRPSPVETAIARELTAKLAVPVTARCITAPTIPATCEAVLLDGTTLPIEIEADGGEWAWRVAGRVIESAVIARHVDATLAEMKIAQRAHCGLRLVFVAQGGRIGCKLTGGGMAFVHVKDDGSTSLELALDPASASARGEAVTPQRERELTRMSLDLERLEGESDGEEEVPPDGGVTNP